jgi:hypothetical protein
MGKRNEQLVNLMKDQFISKPRVINDEDLLKQVQEQNQRSELEQMQRDKQRKVKEMEAKFFQDNQVLMKKEQQRLRQIQKQVDAEVIAQKMHQVKLDEEKEKQ